MKSHIWIGLLSVVLLPGFTSADPWKDESGHGRGGPPPWAGPGGEPPEWARGKGVWDGHFKDNRPTVPRSQFFRNRVWRSRMHYAPPVPYGRVWNDSWDWEKDQWKDRHERIKEYREHERESRKEWREWQREKGRFTTPLPRPTHPSWRWH